MLCLSYLENILLFYIVRIFFLTWTIIETRYDGYRGTLYTFWFFFAYKRAYLLNVLLLFNAPTHHAPSYASTLDGSYFGHWHLNVVPLLFVPFCVRFFKWTCTFPCYLYAYSLPRFIFYTFFHVICIYKIFLTLATTQIGTKKTLQFIFLLRRVNPHNTKNLNLIFFTNYFKKFSKKKTKKIIVQN